MAASKEDLALFADDAPPAPAVPAAPRATDDDLAMFMDRVTAEPPKGRDPRRAAAGMSPGPKDIVDEGEGPEYDVSKRTIGGQIPGLTRNAIPGSTAARTQDVMEGDPLAQTVVTSTLLGPVGNAATGAAKPLLGALTKPIVGAAEGGAASKMTGGDFLPGAAVGLGVGALSALARGATPAAARARQAERLEKDISKGVKGSAANKEARDAIRYHGAEKIGDIGEEIPSVGKALKTQAHANPGAAQKAVDKALDKITDANDAAYAAMQRQHGGIPLQPVAERMAGMEERLNQMGYGVEADAVKRIRTDWLKRYAGDPNVGLADVKLTMQQVRNIRNDMRQIADPTKTMDANTKRSAVNRVANLLNKEIEDIAGQTRGVDVEKLRRANRQISTLIDVRDTLEERALKLSDRDVGLGKRLKEAPGKAAARLGREVDYQLGRVPIGGATPGPAARVPVAPLFVTPEQRKRQEQPFSLRLADALGVQ